MTEIKLLDHGYLKLIETWGSDERIIESARMSTAKGFLGWGPIACATCREEGWPPENCEDKKPGDEKLLRFLWENEHATPFEMAGITIEVKAPIMVFREWHRHRTQCLAGDTLVRCIQSNGVHVYTKTIEDIYRLKYEGVIDNLTGVQRPALDPTGRTGNGRSKAGSPVTRERRLRGNYRSSRIRVLPSCQTRMLRVLDEGSHEFTSALMADVVQSGIKEVWCFRTARGRSVRSSVDHLFLTHDGWKKMGELRRGDRLAANGKVAAMERPVPPSLRRGIGVWTSMMRSRIIDARDSCYRCGQDFPFSQLELDHVVPVVEDLRLALDEANLKPICEQCHSGKTATEQPPRHGMLKLGVCWDEIVRAPERVGEEMTYDIVVDGPHHNFVANGLVVHNSYNEMSARYVPLPNENYMPNVDDLVERSARAATTANRQAAGTGKILEKSDALRWLSELADLYQQAQEVYDYGLNLGVPKELARLPVPVARYSAMRATANLRNWLGFIKLRAAPSAQKEIRVYAEALGTIIAEKFPRTWQLFAEERK